MGLILKREPGAYPVLVAEGITEPRITLEKAQGLVGGLVDRITVAHLPNGREIDLVVNDEGLNLELPPALALAAEDGEIHALAVGPVAFVAATRDGEWVGLTDEEARAVRLMFTGDYLIHFEGGGMVPVIVPALWRYAHHE